MQLMVHSLIRKNRNTGKRAQFIHELFYLFTARKNFQDRIELLL
jgi:hypothetical protein